MTAYADFTYYTGTFLGVDIPAQDFPRLALRASTVIDQLTFDRAAAVIAAGTDAAMIDKIKMAVCAVAEELQTVQAEGRQGAGITSESLGNHSVTYATGAWMTLTEYQRLEISAREYLGNTGLMYRGV